MFGRLLAGFCQLARRFQRNDWHRRPNAWSGGMGLYLNPALSVVGCRLGFRQDCALDCCWVLALNGAAAATDGQAESWPPFPLH